MLFERSRGMEDAKGSLKELERLRNAIQFTFIQWFMYGSSFRLDYVVLFKGRFCDICPPTK